MLDNTAPDDALVADVFSRACGSRALFEVVTGKWAALVLVALAEGEQRFGQLRRRVDGVSEKMLSQALHALEGAELITRTDHGTQPPRVDYALTELGAQVAATVKDLVEVLVAAVNAKASRTHAS